MYWNAANGTSRQAAHDSIGKRNSSSSSTWYLAEGSTGSDSQGYFETWVLVQNPNPTAVNANLTYMTQDGVIDGPDLYLEPESRQSVNVSETVPDTWHVSTKVESSLPVVAERSMYWNTADVDRQAAHDSIGVTEPAQTWYLAEGSTMVGPPVSEPPFATWKFETWVLVQNPGTETAQVSLTYMTDDGPMDGPRFELAPGTRQSINVADTLDQVSSISTRVDSDKPVIVERAMYYNSRYEVYRQAAHCSIGVTGIPTGPILPTGE